MPFCLVFWVWLWIEKSGFELWQPGSSSLFSSEILCCYNASLYLVRCCTKADECYHGLMLVNSVQKQKMDKTNNNININIATAMWQDNKIS